MRKVILAFILSILTFTFLAFLYNAYVLQKNYFTGKNVASPTPTETVVEEVAVPSLYLNYSKEEYDKALTEKRVALLFFTANWCSLCTDQDDVNAEVLARLTKEGVVGLKAHILDSETTVETDALAKKFDITKENSLVILDKNGAVAFKYVGNIENELLKTKIREIVNLDGKSPEEVVNK